MVNFGIAGDVMDDTLKVGWDALRVGDYDSVHNMARVCLDAWEKEALSREAVVNNLPVAVIDNEPVIDINMQENKVLNVVGECLYLDGKAYWREGRKDLARAAYERILHEFMGSYFLIDNHALIGITVQEELNQMRDGNE